MNIGLIYGGRGAEEFSNIKTVNDMEKVLHHYNIKTQRIYLNEEKINFSKLQKIEIFFVIDSNCKNYRLRNLIFEYILKTKKDIIIQNQKAFNIAKDKYKTNAIFNKARLNVPTSILINCDKPLVPSDILEKNKKFIKKIKFPIIIKNNFGSSSEYLNICFNTRDLKRSLSSLSTHCKKLLVEKYIPGKEVTSPFIKIYGKNLVLNSLEITYDGYIYDYKTKNKTFRNKLRIPPKLSRRILTKIKKITNMANILIGCNYYSRLDLKIWQNKIFILEINSEPVLSKNDFLARCAKTMGITYSKLIIGFLSNLNSFTQYAKYKNKKLYSFIVNSKNSIDTMSKFYFL